MKLLSGPTLRRKLRQHRFPQILRLLAKTVKQLIVLAGDFELVKDALFERFLHCKNAESNSQVFF